VIQVKGIYQATYFNLILNLQNKDFFVTFVVIGSIDFRYRMLAFRGACGEPPRRYAPIGVSPVPLVPQESRTLHSNQFINEDNCKNNLKATIL
jgi:hypothetical protein